MVTLAQTSDKGSSFPCFIAQDALPAEAGETARGVSHCLVQTAGRGDASALECGWKLLSLSPSFVHSSEMALCGLDDSISGVNAITQRW